MLDTIIYKPITEENRKQFNEAMKYVCNHDDLTMMEYIDKYVVAKAPEPLKVVFENSTISTEERLDNIENALIELAELLTEEK